MVWLFASPSAVLTNAQQSFNLDVFYASAAMRNLLLGSQ
jgi:hypothetical protein